MQDVTLSPDGWFRVNWSVNTGRMSHEIWSPLVTLTATEEVLFDLRDGDIDASFDWLGNGAFQMRLRRYSRSGHILDVWVDASRRVFRLGAEGPEQPLESVQKAILEVF
jgi:hypothetical protein